VKIVGQVSEWEWEWVLFVSLRSKPLEILLDLECFSASVAWPLPPQTQKSACWDPGGLHRQGTSWLSGLFPIETSGVTVFASGEEAEQVAVGNGT